MFPHQMNLNTTRNLLFVIAIHTGLQVKHEIKNNSVAPVSIIHMFRITFSIHLQEKLKFFMFFNQKLKTGASVNPQKTNVLQKIFKKGMDNNKRIDLQWWMYDFSVKGAPKRFCVKLATKT